VDLKIIIKYYCIKYIIKIIHIKIKKLLYVLLTILNTTFIVSKYQQVRTTQGSRSGIVFFKQCENVECIYFAYK